MKKKKKRGPSFGIPILKKKKKPQNTGYLANSLVLFRMMTMGLLSPTHGYFGVSPLVLP